LFFLCQAVAGVSLNPAEMDKLSDVHLANGGVFSGDEFLVIKKDRKLHLKLYLAECPHLSCLNKQDSLRLEYLSFYWGLTNSDTLLHFAPIASEFTRKTLAKPFTVYTKYQLVNPGCDSVVYAFVKTDSGGFLSYMLIENGFSRVRPEGMDLLEISYRKCVEPEIRRREIKAILQRNGIWACTVPDQLIQQQSKIKNRLTKQKIRTSNTKAQHETNSLMDINSASIEDLRIVKGIGPKTAEKIVAGRPYKSMEDLLRVKGIGPKTLEKIKEHFEVQSKSK
jgi:competence ComEA-like helix-hairpin-helix protein